MVMEGRYYYSLVPDAVVWERKKQWYTQSAQWKLKSSGYYAVFIIIVCCTSMTKMAPPCQWAGVARHYMVT